MEKISNALHSKIAKNGIYMILLQGFNTIIPLLALPYITRILSPSAYGEFSIALNWVGYFQVIVEYGFALNGSRRAAIYKEKEKISEIHSNIICARIVLFILCVLMFVIIIIATRIDKVQIVCMAILFLMVFAVVFQQNWFFQGIAEMKNITVINVISRSISVVLIFLLVKKPSDLYLYCLLYISNFVISSLFGCLVVWFRYKIRFSLVKSSAIKQELINAGPLFVSSAMSKIFGGIGITVLSIISTEDAVGVYSAINKIPCVLTLIFAAISQTLYPFMCNAFEISFNNGLRSVKKYGRPVFLFFAIGGLLIIATNNSIVRIALGADYVDSSTLLIPFVIWVLFGIINNFLGIQILVASGHQKEYSIAFTISVTMMFGLMIVLGKLLGAYGIAYASMISEMILSLILAVFVKSIIKNKKRVIV